MTTYFIENNKVDVIPHDAINIKQHLPIGTYLVKLNDETKQLFLEKVSDFKSDMKLYGKIRLRTKRVIKTFLKRDVNTGVLLSGMKGSGKSLSAMDICSELQKLKISTVMVNESFDSNTLSKFISSIQEPTVFLFDEFEKNYTTSSGGARSLYNNNDSKTSIDNNQNGFLTLLDGVYKSKKLFIFTCNNISGINKLFLNRPGRILYHIEFQGISDQVIKEYTSEFDIKENILNEILIIRDRMGGEFTFDMLKAIVEETLRYDETPFNILEYINIKPDLSQATFNITLESKNDTEVTLLSNPFITKWDFPDKDNYYRLSYKEGDEHHSANLYERDLATITNNAYIFEKNNVKIIFTRVIKDSNKEWKDLDKSI